MRGRIKVGVWLPFTAVQTVDGRSFAWQAQVGRWPLQPLRVTDGYADAIGRTEGRLLGHLKLFGAEDFDTARSAATRTAIESVVFAPPSVLPDRGVTWRAETDHVIVARFDLPPEHPEVRLCIDDHGAQRTVSALRWGNAGERPSSTSRSEANSTPSAASATSCFPAAQASAGGSAPRATSRSSTRASATSAHVRRAPPDPRRERGTPDRPPLRQSTVRGKVVGTRRGSTRAISAGSRLATSVCSVHSPADQDQVDGELRETRSCRVGHPDARRGPPPYGAFR